jgi:hypothetical protein
MSSARIKHALTRIPMAAYRGHQSCTAARVSDGYSDVVPYSTHKLSPAVSSTSEDGEWASERLQTQELRLRAKVPILITERPQAVAS